MDKFKVIKRLRLMNLLMIYLLHSLMKALAELFQLKLMKIHIPTIN